MEVIFAWLLHLSPFNHPYLTCICFVWQSRLPKAIGLMLSLHWSFRSSSCIPSLTNFFLSVSKPMVLMQTWSFSLLCSFMSEMERNGRSHSNFFDSLWSLSVSWDDSGPDSSRSFWRQWSFSSVVISKPMASRFISLQVRMSNRNSRIISVRKKWLNELIKVRKIV